jgi:hypothetical protein
MAMTQAIDNDSAQQRDQWISRIKSVIEEVTGWAEAEGWRSERDCKTIEEKTLGEYEAPRLTIYMPEGEILVQPVALRTLSGNNGRIDIEAIPTLSRVKLLGRPEGWTIMTDSRVPLRLPWNRETFVQLAKDLLS